MSGRTVPARPEARPENQPEADAELNWADLIDSLHEFRAPTVRLARIARRDAERTTGTDLATPAARRTPDARE